MSEIAIKTEKPDDSASLDEEGLGVAALSPPSSNNLVTRRQEAASVPAMRAAMRAAATQAASAANRNPGPAAQHIQLKQQLQRKLNRASVQQPIAPPPKPFLPGARCGEIFVANNARQWTFICTFCNKSTRDIGDFICHIKMKHLQESDYPPAMSNSGGGGYYDDEQNADLDDYGGPQQQQTDEQDVSYNFTHLRNIRVSSSKAIEIIPIQPPPPPMETSKKRQTHTSEYLDCGSYLDVNVHTEDHVELGYNGVSLQQQQHQQALARKRHMADAAVVNSSANKVAKKSTAKSSNPTPNPRDSFVVELLDDDEDDGDGGEQDDGAAPLPEDYDENDIEQNIATHTSQRRIEPKSEKQKYANANGGRKVKPEAPVDYDDFDYSDEQYPHAAEELRRHNQNSAHFGDGDDDEDDDFDNQLLIAPGADDSSLEASALSASLGVGGGGGGGTESKRRQIRGTAYCALCNKTFQYYSLYRNHMIKHSNDTPYKCVLCKKGFKSKQAIRYHMHTHQKEKKYQCQLCHHGYYTENQYITHVLTHENASMFPCMVCGKILRSDKERDNHLATHTEERPFRCEFCNKLFRLRHHLSNHLKMHRQYRCDWCREEFTSAVHLRKPYACPVCEQLPEVRSNQTQKHRSSASSSLDADPTGGGSGSGSGSGAGDLVNPLHLFETVEPPTECVDLAEMVSDSDGDEEPAQDEDEYEPEQEDDEDEEDLTAEPENNSRSYLAQQQQQRHRQQQQQQQNQSAAGVQPERQRLTCKYCHRSYSHLSGLNYHIRMKHR